MDFYQTVNFDHFYHALSIVLKWISASNVRWKYDLVNIKESIIPVGDGPYHKNTKKAQEGGGVKRFAERCIGISNVKCGSTNTTNVTL